MAHGTRQVSNNKIGNKSCLVLLKISLKSQDTRRVGGDFLLVFKNLSLTRHMDNTTTGLQAPNDV